MKICLTLLLGVVSPWAALASDAFPGLRAIMTPQEYSAAGLDKLLPVQVDVIDGAVARHYRESVRREAVNAAGQPAAAAPPTPAAPWWQHFGLPNLQSNWRTQPALKARVTAWTGGNRFALDNGQVWEGLTPIPSELPGKEIEIQARPLNEFALAVDGRSTGVRVRRLR